MSSNVGPDKSEPIRKRAITIAAVVISLVAAAAIVGYRLMICDKRSIGNKKVLENFGRAKINRFGERHEEATTGRPSPHFEVAV